MFDGHSITGRNFKAEKEKKVSEKEAIDTTKASDLVPARSHVVPARDEKGTPEDDFVPARNPQESTNVEYVPARKKLDRTASFFQKTNITVSLPKDLKMEMDDYPEIIWSKVAREAFLNKIHVLKSKDLMDDEAEKEPTKPPP